MFPPAEVLKRVDVSDYKDMDEARKLIFDLIVQYRRMKNSGVVAVYQKERFDEYSNFARIGDGSLGGKGRGLAFIGAMVKRYPKLEHDHFAVTIPKTVVICTDIFDEFMETNELYPVVLSEVDDETILKYFLRASLPARLIEDLMAFFDVVKVRLPSVRLVFWKIPIINRSLGFILLTWYPSWKINMICSVR